MSAKRDNGGAAFPSSYEWRNDGDMLGRAPNGMPVPPGGVESIHSLGMTLRDYFAAKAMSGWLSSYPDHMEAATAITGVDVVARFAYAMADAMLNARLK